jgi:pimeloyl-ACP methyl ester carboxylesterase
MIQTRRTGRFRRWTKLIFVALAALILVLVAVGAIYQYFATVEDSRRYPPPGKMVDVGGFKMHLDCVGDGSPTVVLDNGLFFGSFGWHTVPQGVVEFTRVCTFDRAGIGWSEASPHGRGIDQINKELHELLIRAGEREPFVFAGHSIAGLYVQNYSNNYAKEVAGIVFIDSSHAEQTIRDPISAWTRMLLRIGKIAAPLGVVRLFISATAADSPEMAASLCSTKHFYASADEFLTMDENARHLREKPMQLGDKPLVVLTRNLTASPDDTEEDVRHNESWKEMQTDLASRSNNAKHLVSDKSGHIMHKDEPELVIRGIRHVVEAARAASIPASQPSTRNLP